MRYYCIAGITVRVAADVPLGDETFAAKFKQFQVDGPGDDTISIRHYTSLPEVTDEKLGKQVFRRRPWVIYRRGQSWVYLVISSQRNNANLNNVVVCNQDHTRMRIYTNGDQPFKRGGLHSLTALSTDQIVLARVLADRHGCYVHSSGVILDGRGLLFVGHSGAGKSTMVRMLKKHATILCDDRMIIRRWPDGFRIHGTWSHGAIPTVSNEDAPLRAIFFLEKATTNCLIPITEKREVFHNMLSFVVRPLVTADWWAKMLELMSNLASDVPAYRLQFDKSGRAVDVLKQLAARAPETML